MEEQIRQSIDNLIGILHKVHCNNSKQQYYAYKYGRQISIMPLTPFVYEFFLFNSLYQVDWHKSYDKNELIFHPDDYSDSKQQKEFVKHLKSHSKNNPSDLYRAFEPLIYLPVVDGEWTVVTPDARIRKEDGKNFFENIKELQTIIESCKNPNEMPTTKKVFKLIDKGVYYIYLVRNNIFHGSKTLDEVSERDQKRRIEIYEIFLKGVTSLFFLSAKKRTVASDFIPCPITLRSLTISEDTKLLDQDFIWSAINRRAIKLVDPKLIAQFTKRIPPPKSTPSEKSTLFYPSAGSDILTPLLLGLPYCRQFYFYERSQNRTPPLIQPIIRKIPTAKLIDHSKPPRWGKLNDTHYLDFEYDGILRRIHWIHSDNMEFLKSDAELCFYFHRGDSLGEGGSGQRWDSELLPKLIDMIPDNQTCFFLTDGEPGGIDKEYMESCGELNIPNIQGECTYSFGILANKKN